MDVYLGEDGFDICSPEYVGAAGLSPSHREGPMESHGAGTLHLYSR